MADALSMIETPPFHTVTPVAVQGVTKHYGDLAAVEDLSFSVAAGTVTGFLGPNGAGKTTTLRMVLGLAEPTRGSALVFGRRFAELERPACRVGAVLEAADLHPGRSARDHLRVLATAAQLPPSRADEVLALVDLAGAARRRAKGFSLGMRQRLSLAAALLGDPELLILDEPANGLDPEGVHWLRDFLRAFAAEGRTVLVSSHLLAEVAQTVDRVVIISRGRLVREAPLADVLAQRGAVVRVRAPRLELLEPAVRQAGGDTARANGALLVRGLSPKRVSEIALEARIALDELASDSSSLEDAFLQLTSEGQS